MPQETVRKILEEGRGKVRQRNYEEALRLFDRALQLDPRLAVAWFNRGWILKMLGRFEEAVEAFDRGLEIDPGSFDAWKNKGIALYKIGRVQEAIRAYERANDLRKSSGTTIRSGSPAEVIPVKNPPPPERHRPVPPENSAAVSPPEQGSSGKPGMANPPDQLEAGIQKYQDEIAVNPDDARAFAGLSRLLIRLGRWNEAVAAAERTLAINRINHIKAWLTKGLVWAGQGNFSAVQESIDHALETTPDDSWGNTGLILVKEERQDEAILSSDEILAENRKTDTEALEVKVYASIHFRNFQEALDLANRAIGLDPTNPHLWYAKAFALYSYGRYDDALLAIDQSLTIHPGMPDAWQVKSWILDRLGRASEAAGAEQHARALTTVRR